MTGKYGNMVVVLRQPLFKKKRPVVYFIFITRNNGPNVELGTVESVD